MALRVTALATRHLAAAKEFNHRLRAGGVPPDFMMAEAVPTPADPSRPVCKEQYVVAGPDGVHGAFMIQHQDFLVGGRIERIGNYQMPISEGVVDRAYASVGLIMLRDALRMRPRLFALGMGGRDNALPRMLQAMGWRLWDVPFLFHVHRAAPFLRQIVPLRSSQARCIALDVAATTGVGSLAFELLQLRFPLHPTASFAVEDRFGPWADSIWERARDHLSFAAHRTLAMLESLYDSDDSRFVRLRVHRDDQNLGWAVVLSTHMMGHRYFGALKVGTLVDCLAIPGECEAVASCVLDYLEAQQVDLTVTNQSHQDWIAALKARGFLEGPSNYVLAASPRLAEFLGDERRMHITRGDGDGPLGL